MPPRFRRDAVAIATETPTQSQYLAKAPLYRPPALPAFIKNSSEAIIEAGTLAQVIVIVTIESIPRSIVGGVCLTKTDTEAQILRKGITIPTTVTE